MLTPTLETTAIKLQDRDYEVLRGLFESRVMTSAHVASLFFGGKREATKKRLQKLKVAGLIGERRRRAYEASVLHLTGKAFVVLREQGILSEYPAIGQATLEKRARVSDFTIRHELEVMDVKAAFHKTIGQSATLFVAEFCTWPLLHQFESFRAGHGIAEVVVKPDGFIRIHEKEQDGGLLEHTFFLEVDRSSETQDTLVNRATCYFDYYKSGGFAERNGAPRSAYKNFPFRVLMVFKNAERRNNTAERLLRTSPPILTQACLTTIDEVTKDPLGNIWLCPIDYREAVRGTPYEANQRNGGWSYRRQSAREILIEQRVKKLPLLA